ncbi:hypothetical protein Tco_1544931 [Tanacetum coccineum]
MKCTSAIRQMAYGAIPDALDEYLRMGETIARDSLRLFCKAIMELYGDEFLRKPAYIDMKKLYAHHEEKHGFPRIALIVQIGRGKIVQLHSELNFLGVITGQIHSFYWKRYPPMIYGFGMRSLVSPE